MTTHFRHLLYFVITTLAPSLRNSSSLLSWHVYLTALSSQLGKWGVSPPHLVLPLPVEPSKPRLYHDERFLNLWIQDLPFSLDKITDLPAAHLIISQYLQSIREEQAQARVTPKQVVPLIFGQVLVPVRSHQGLLVST